MSNWSFVDDSPPGWSGSPGRFDDARSRKQITVYLAYRSRAGDERNQRALAHWNDNLRQQWEIEHLHPSAAARGARTGHVTAAKLRATLSRPA